jgi:hypothetical protein
MTYDIRQHYEVLVRSKKSKTKYICPVCQGDDLDINPKTGAYNCFSGNCLVEDIRKEIDHLEGTSEWQPDRTERAYKPPTSPAWIKPRRLDRTTIYDYPDRNGNPLVRVKRIDSQGTKKFVQQHWDGSQWAIGNPASLKPQIPIYRYQDTSGAIKPPLWEPTTSILPWVGICSQPEI